MTISSTSNASEIPEPTLPAGVGVNIHFVSGHQQDLDLMQAAGFKFIRMDFGWTSTEPRKGEYDWSGYEELLSNLERRQMRAIFILDYSHHLYEEAVTSPNPLNGQARKNTASPQHPESVAAFARWAAAATKHFHGRHVLWEIWNEPNIHFWSPKPDAQQYTALALAACKAIREADPQATIVAPATSELPWEFLEAVFKSGALDYLDAVSVHPYRNPRRPPETAAADYQRLRALIDQYAPAARKGRIPILSGEWGYSSNTKGVSLETQAAFAARQQLSNMLEGMPLSIWYDWKNDGDDPKENEHNFGTVMPDLKPKPAYTAIKTLTHELTGFGIARRVPLTSTNDYVLICTNSAGAESLVAWTLGEPHPVTVAHPVKDVRSVRAVTWNGEPFTPQTSAGGLTLELGPMPRYVSLGADARK